MKEKQEFNLPLLGRSNKSVAELVLIILTEEWPLSTRGLVNRLKRFHAKEVSFQSVHKAIKKLHNEEILTKTENYYKINPDWLNQIKNFSTTINQKYEQTETMLKDLP